MSRLTRGTGASGPLSSLPPALATSPDARGLTPAASSEAKRRRPRPSPASAQLTQLAGAVARSQAKVPSQVPSQGPEADAHAHAHASAESLQRTLDLASGPTPEQAAQFAQLLRAGVPQPDALCYVLGDLDEYTLASTLPRWMRARATVEALATLNGGRWPALDPDARLDIALNKHYAEMAHYLYTHDFETAAGKDLGKLNVARESLETLRTGRMEENSPFVKFLRAVLAPKAQVTLPPAADPGSNTGDGYRAPTLGLVEVYEGEVTETDHDHA